TVLSVKQRLATILGKGREFLKEMRLLSPGKPGEPYNVLEDSGVLEQLGISEDDKRAVICIESLLAGTAEGAWESVNVPDFEPLGDESEAVPDDKGKGAASNQL
ncbi:hypothetical protein HDU96_008852, partial [Phlyctochytrium bullatum]